MTNKENKRFYLRDISWLSFNYRVLQEAKDKTVPLYERIKFLGIFSSNLEEFFKVRVAYWRRISMLKTSEIKSLKPASHAILKKIHDKVYEYQQEFYQILWEQIVPELKTHNIFLINEKELSDIQKVYVKQFFDEQLVKDIEPFFITSLENVPVLKDLSIYFAIILKDKADNFQYALLEVPTKQNARFIELPSDNEKKHYIIYIDDIVRVNLPSIFPQYEVINAYSIRLSRDAELYLEDEFSGSLLNKIKKKLKQRKYGAPTRLQYDRLAPQKLINLLKTLFGLKDIDLFPSGRYHRGYDFMSFPKLLSEKHFYKPLEPLRLKRLEEASSLFSEIRQKDVLLFYPYHSYHYVIRFLKEAAFDPLVTDIKITLYRLAENDSQVIENLIAAQKNGKKVTAFLELKARFNEKSNIFYAEQLEKAGVKILYSLPALKVHAKMLLVTSKELDKTRRYAYLSTGNFNENTARVYSDFGLFTYNKNITREVVEVFEFLIDTRRKYEYSHLLVAPDHMRKDLYGLIDNEIKNKLRGKNAYITLKLNSLEDEQIINKLYEASQDGVKIRIIVRSISCLVPGIKGLSENITITSIVDRFLEHARVLIFCNDDNPLYFMSSADWMNRNLSRRIEVAFPILDKDMQKIVEDIIKIQLADNTKARIINATQNNRYKKVKHGEKQYRAQFDIYDYLKNSNL